MPMPHRTQMQLIKRRLTGKEGSARLRELRSILDELPNYKNGPYADIRRWVMEQMDETRLRSRVVQRDAIAVRREGAAQIALVGPPNAGKSSLLHALCGMQIKVGDYAFTTLRPVPALADLGGVLVQFVEIPGLIAGANENRGGGRALLGVLRGADAVVYCQAVNAPLQALRDVRAEVEAAGISLPAMLAITKLDEGSEADVQRLVREFPGLPAVGVSVIDDKSLERFQAAAWALTGLIRVYLQHAGRTDRPLALPAGATVVEAARAIHKDLAAACRGARLWGPSARFPGQRVGRPQPLQDGDTVEIIT